MSDGTDFLPGILSQYDENGDMIIDLSVMAKLYQIPAETLESAFREECRMGDGKIKIDMGLDRGSKSEG